VSSSDIKNLSIQELVHYLNAIGEKPFRATQIFEWLYQKGSESFDKMGNLPKALRQRLAQDFVLKSFQMKHKDISSDGTTKFLFDLEDHQKVETVLIPTSKRITVCVSSQAGCKFGCKFCASGMGGWIRDLSCAEILTQVLYAKSFSKGANSCALTCLPVSHIVFMGIGEPFDNFENVMKAIRIINDQQGLNIGARRITVSTCGVIPKIQALAKEGLQIELAISLHGYDNDSRNILMPVNRKYPFDDLMETCREYIRKTKRQITFEYILIKDVTCSDKAVKTLKKAFQGLICKMNLIAYNPVSEFDYQTPFEISWREAQEWTSNYTPIDSLFIVPPYINGFRTFSYRSR